MTKAQDSIAVVSPPAGASGGRWLYPLLLSLQTAGAVLLCLEVVPIYRQALADPAAYSSSTTLRAIGGITLIQAAYWTRYRLHPTPPRFVNVLLGHIVIFASRLIFVLPGAIFSFLFITETSQAHLPVSRYIVIFSGLFSLFCYVSELERLGTRLLGQREA